ncbi:MAG: HAMP domain-containing sensor histidine kinase [Acidimicrobiales bacterium]
MTLRLGWPRSLRARLVVIYTVVAVALGVAGVAAFSVLLHRGVVASVDATLQGRVAPLVAQLDSGTFPAGTPPVGTPPVGTPPVGTPTARAGPGSAGGGGAQGGPGSHGGTAILDSFVAVYRPDGRLAQIQPAGTGAPPLDAAQVAAARSGSRTFTISGGDQQLRVLATPVPRPDGTWVVVAGSDLGDVDEAADQAVTILQVTVAALILLAAAGAWLLSGAALRPVERMRADAANLGERDPVNRITVPATGDELASLARTFNGLLDRLTRSLARQRDLIADASHELRTPLAVLRTELELADTPARSVEELADAVAHARGEVERLSKIADDLLFLARADGAAPLVDPVDTDLAAMAAETIRAHRAAADAAGVHLDLHAPSPVTARADPAALRRALDNLLANALAVTPPGGQVVLTVTDGDPAVISVADTGPGFPPDFLDDAFGRFTRPDPARPAGGGAGLGLAIVAEIVHAHGGQATAANNPTGGATVALTVPADRPGTPVVHEPPMFSGR